MTAAVLPLELSSAADAGAAPGKVLRLGSAAIGLAAVGGYVFRRALLAPWFWVGGFWGVLGVDAVFLWYATFLDTVGEMEPAYQALLLGAMLALMAPQYLAHFRYAFRRPAAGS